MTYGWAILIIAIVMVALFQLGVFNGTFFAPRATAGACEVYRSIASVSLAGQCNNELPQFVAQFNGASSYVQVSASQAIDTSSSVTISAWIFASGSNADKIAGTYYGNYYGYLLWMGGPLSLTFTVGGGPSINYNVNSQAIAANQWTMVTGIYNSTSSTIYLYVNGKMSSYEANVLTASYSSQPFVIGKDAWDIYGPFAGSISNVQLYNISLSQSEVTALYDDGIGGAPVDPTHIVGWWPLNGNAQDYSGNNNGGTPTNVLYTGSWTSGYTQP